MSGYIGSAAVLASSGAERKKTYSITGATTSLTGLNYTVGQVHVFHNGVRLVDGTDFTATNGNSITLTNAAQSGDEVVVLSYAGYQVSDTVSASQGGTFSNDIAITGDLTVDTNTLYVDSTNNNVGIGTSSPSFVSGGGLHVHNSSVARLKVTNSTTGSASTDGYEFQAFEDDLYILGREAAGNMIFSPNNSEAMRIDSSGRVGIGTSSPSEPLMVNGNIFASTGDGGGYKLEGNSGIFRQGITGMGFNTNGSEAMRLDGSGNLLVGKTSTAFGTDGVEIKNDQIWSTNTSSDCLSLNRKTTDGALATFYKDGSTVGSIGKPGGANEIYIAASGSNSNGILFSNGNSLIPMKNANISDNTQDIGTASYRWDDIFATNGTIQTSDRNEKQDIETLSEAEQRVAVACKGLLRKFRWKDAVAEKGDDARIHFGIIAQDLQDAFAAEGLDAGRYAMFISNTWWETQTDVPAVEAVAEVLDEDGNVVTEAVEAKEAYTRTDTYETLEEAPEGATERTRLGVRYPELLAFIIGAM